MKHLIETIFVAMFCALVTGCVYPYDPDPTADDRHQFSVVVEGDILVGEISQFKFSSTRPLYNGFHTVEYDKMDYFMQHGVRLWVESSNGDRYQGEYTRDYVYSVDTRSLDKSMKYRLCFRINDNTYSSEWSEVLRAAPVDEVSSYVNTEDDKVHILVSTHTDINSPYIKWFYKEDFEYHSRFSASVYPDFTQMKVIKYELGQFNHSICYKEEKSDKVMIYNTESLSGNQLLEHDLYSIDREDRKISYLLRSTVYQMALSKEAYIYWNTIMQNSQDMGNLFSPQPAEVRGNIICENNPDEVVLGYVSVSTVTSNSGYYRDKDYGFYIEEYKCNESKMSGIDYLGLYYSGYLPYGVDMGAVYWAKTRCVDCEYFGGSVYGKPEDWPE